MNIHEGMRTHYFIPY